MRKINIKFKGTERALREYASQRGSPKRTGHRKITSSNANLKKVALLRNAIKKAALTQATMSDAIHEAMAEAAEDLAVSEGAAAAHEIMNDLLQTIRKINATDHTAGNATGSITSDTPDDLLSSTNGGLTRKAKSKPRP